MATEIAFRVLTPSRFADLERLFGERGACEGCWCMFWRVPRSVFHAQQGDANRRALRELIRRGSRPGLLAYAGRRPVGWVAVEPRSEYASLQRSRRFPPVDARPVWAIPCLFVAEEHRGEGLTERLLEAAVDHARRTGAELVEAYPLDLDRGHRVRPSGAYLGIASTFRRLGFVPVARSTGAGSHLIMRRTLKERRGS